MTARIILLNPARHFIANRAGVGYLTPLGLVFLGGPLMDAGHEVRLIDHDMNGWSMKKLLAKLGEFQPHYILLGHSGSTASHNVVVKTVKAIRVAFPHIRIIYGGVYPSYAYQSILQDVPEIDVIVRGEGEQVTCNLIDTWETGPNLENVAGIAWRRGGEIVVNRPQNCWIFQNTKCSVSRMWPDFNSAGDARLLAATAGNGCSGRSGGIAARRISSSS
jgi:anaerobic magnesium-protoporphyrin IX monomethyl ester cyclase